MKPTFQNPAINSRWEEYSTAAIYRALIAAIANVHAATFAAISYEGNEKCPKKLGIVGSVTKLSKGSVQLFYSYENAVNNRLEKQGDERIFEAQSLPWGEWLIPNKFIRHNGGLYLRVYTYDGGIIKSNFFVNGRPATEEENIVIREWKAAKDKTSHTQAAAGLEDNQCKPFSINALNIVTIQSGVCSYNREKTISDAYHEFMQLLHIENNAEVRTATTAQ